MEIISSSSSPRNIQEKHQLNNPLKSPTPPQTPKSQANNTNTYPTTFVQADTSNFKQVVQLLTGSSTSSSKTTIITTTNINSTIPPIKTTPQKNQGFKLHERRKSLKNGLMVDTFASKTSSINHGFSPRHKQTAELLSPSILDFPLLALSPITPPLVREKNLKSLSTTEETTKFPFSAQEEDKAIAEKKFYLHAPSPRSNVVEPQLLPLFPLTSPRVLAGSPDA